MFSIDMQSVTVDEIMKEGLLLVGFSVRRQRNVHRSTNVDRFRKSFGSLPIVYASVWYELQTVEAVGMRIDTQQAFVSLKTFLRSAYFLRKYPTEEEQVARFGNCDKSVRKWMWYFVNKIAGLKAKKVCVIRKVSKRMFGQTTD